MKTEHVNQKSKLCLKRVSNPNDEQGPHSLDKIREVGSYTWIAESITEEMGFPSCVKDTDDCLFCEGQLFVMRHGAEETNQSTDSFGQVLTIINHKTGGTNIFTRSLHPLQDNGKWTTWQMVATGDPKLIADNNSINEAISALRQQIEDERLRAQISETKLQYDIDYLKEYSSIDALVQRGDAARLADLFRIGNIAISADSWGYSDSKRRVSTKEGVTIPLTAGDTVSLSDYSDTRFFLGWKNKNGEYKYSGWHTSDVIISQDGDYVVNIAHINEVDLTSKEELFDLLQIKNKPIVDRLAIVENTTTNVSLISSAGELPNFDTSNKILDLGQDPVLIVGKKSYALKIKHQNNESKYRSIPYVIEGITSGAIKIVFNINTVELYPLNYTQTLADDEVAIGGVRLTWGADGKFVHANMPFDFTVDGKNPTGWEDALMNTNSEVEALAFGIANISSFTQGALGNTTGALNTSIKYRVSSASAITCYSATKISIATGYKFTIRYYNENGEQILDSGWVNTSTTAATGSIIKIMIARQNEDTSLTLSVEEAINAISVDSHGVCSDIADINKNLKNLNGDDILPEIEIVNGHCNGTTGNISSSGTRLISKEKLSLNGRFLVDATSVKGKTLKFYVVRFNKNDGSLVDWSGWYSPLIKQLYEFDSDFLYVLEFGFMDDSNITPADVAGVKFYRVAAREKQELLCNTGLSFIAHRGFHLNGVPENSLDAYRYAARCGFKYVETDFCPTSDGELVLMHDESINRTMRNKADYSEIAAEVNVIDRTLEELRSSYVLSATDHRMRREIPTLEEFLVTCRSCDLFPILEIKGSNLTNELLEKSFELAAGIMGDGNFGYCSFSASPLDYMRSLSKKIPLLYIIKGGLVGTKNSVTQESRESENTWWYPPYPGYDNSYGVSKESIREHRSKGLKVAVWSPPVSQVDSLLKLGVDAIAADTVAPNIGGFIGYVVKSDTDFDDFSTDGIVESNGISLSSGQTITANFGNMWLGGYFLSIIGKGYFSVEAPNLNITINNDKVERYLFQGLVNNSIAKFTIKANADTVIEFIEYSAVEL